MRSVLLFWWEEGAPYAVIIALVERDASQVLSVMITLSILVDGKSNWLEGLMLQLTYLIIAVAFW